MSLFIFLTIVYVNRWNSQYVEQSRTSVFLFEKIGRIQSLQFLIIKLFYLNILL